MSEFANGFVMGALTMLAAMVGLVAALIAWREGGIVPAQPPDDSDWSDR